MSSSNEILDFWFGKVDHPSYSFRRKAWFTKDPKFDSEISERFLLDYEKAAAGELAHWKDISHSCLALILLLDQFPRNLFRGDARTYATDMQALSLTRFALSQGYDQELIPVQRWFIYFPLGHSESLDDQHQVKELVDKLGDDPDSIFISLAAHKHLEVIKRFGRFPHRNQILNRKSTHDEEEFLRMPGATF
jgi:uncharacterized protein (DUF924 family)